MRSLWPVLVVAACQSKSAEKQEPQVSTPAPQSTPAPEQPAQQEPPAQDRPPPPPLPDPLPGKRTDLTAAVGSAWRGAIADVDGDGKREIIVVDSKAIRVLDPTGRQITSSPVPGGIQVLLAVDLDGDKRAEIYAGWGQTRDHMDAKAKVTVHRFERSKLVEELVLTPETSRQEVVALVPMFDTKGLLVSYFDSKYMVTTTAVTRAKEWTATKLAQFRTATSYARGDLDGDGKPEVVVGRVYGDDKGIDGDAFVLAPDGSRKLIPSTRGLRSIAIADGDGDGKNEVFMGDGWHQNYGQHARGLLTWARPTKDGGFTTELIEDTPGQFEIMRIHPAKLGGKFALVTHGSHYVRVFTREANSWKGQTIAGASRDVAVGDVDGEPGDEILVIGDKSELVKF